MNHVLPEGAEWATAPLLDPSNVGKYVWADWNGNEPVPAPIVKIGRTNIHCGRSRPHSMRVEPGGHRAIGMVNGYTVGAMTEQWRIERDERRELVAAIGRFFDRGWNNTPTASLREILALMKGSE